MSTRLRDLALDLLYAGRGEHIAGRLLLPALAVSRRYDRLSSYFTVASFVSIARGLEGLRENGGTMRLVVGAHAVDPDLRRAGELAYAAEVVEQVRQRFIADVTTLVDELERDRLATVAWMIRDGLLDVRCAAPKHTDSVGQPIFHSKRFLFVDHYGDLVTATGSPNETVSGLGGNFEEVTVHRSWTDSEGYTRAHLERFETVWQGREPELVTTRLDDTFADEILEALGGHRRRGRAASGARGDLATDRLLVALRDSPALALLNSSERPLYLHQERVLIEAGSRWPIRAVLADEVGLGKTYEAASVVHFAVHQAGVKRVCVLAPPTLLRQWQDEFTSSFGLDFWRFDSSSKTYVAPDERTIEWRGGPFTGDYPGLTLVSRDLARGDRVDGHAFLGASQMPDLLVVDEAHAARKSRDLSGGVKDTLLRRMLEDVLPSVPHALFLTATPMQVHPEELRDLLHLLGLPDAYDPRSYRRSLDLLCTPTGVNAELQTGADALRLIDASVDGYRPKAVDREDASLRSLMSFRPTDRVAQLVRRQSASASWPMVHDALVRYHPAAMLVLRNTRGALESLGYRFPTRRLESVEASGTVEGARVLGLLEQYLEQGLGRVESALYPERSRSFGLVVSTYRQRVASSLRSALATLEGRAQRIETLVATGRWAELREGDEGPAGSDEGPQAVDDKVRAASAAELADLRTVSGVLRAYVGEDPDADPKLSLAMDLIANELDLGRSCLVFSKYTATVDAVIDRFRRRFGDGAPYGVYTGAGAEVWNGSTRVRGQKHVVTEALEDGRVRVVFCSDAASEGLNLQSASVLLNIDVPWNPARLEQRIGRIARLGQAAPEVVVYNLWYPNSVEARIYARLLERRQDFEVALGAFPELVDDAIKRAVMDRDAGSAGRSYALADLQAARESVQVLALAQVWGDPVGGRNGTTGTEAMRQRLLKVLMEIAQGCGWQTESNGEVVDLVRGGQGFRTSASAGSRYGFTLRAAWIGVILQDASPSPLVGETEELGVVHRGDRPLLLATRSSGSTTLLRPDALPEVLAALFLGSSLDLNAWRLAPDMGQAGVRFRTADLQGWWPDPRRLSVEMGLGTGAVPPLPVWVDDDQPWVFESIGHVQVAKVAG